MPWSTTGSGTSTCMGRGSLGFKFASPLRPRLSVASGARAPKIAQRRRDIVVIRLAELNAGIGQSGQCWKKAEAENRSEEDGFLHLVSSEADAARRLFIFLDP